MFGFTRRAPLERQQDTTVVSNAKRACTACGGIVSLQHLRCEKCGSYHKKHWSELDGITARLLCDTSDLP
jgi:rRNA maturation endonuclease Nob1